MEHDLYNPNLIGTTQGKLKILSETKRIKRYKKTPVYKCQCSCGKKKNILASDIFLNNIFCCKICNWAKYKLTLDQFITHVTKIKNHMPNWDFSKFNITLPTNSIQ